MATFVIVPGGWHGGWWFEPLARRLRRHGHEAYPLTLTGVGDRIHLLTASVNLGTHTRDVTNVLEAERIEYAVLVDHRYGGMVITGAADRVPERVDALVYIDAFVPGDGDALTTWPVMTYADGTLREPVQTATPPPRYLSSTPGHATPARFTPPTDPAHRILRCVPPRRHS